MGMGKKKKAGTTERLKKIELHISQLEKLIHEAIGAWNQKSRSAETPVNPWLYLVRRQHPWRKQLYLKGRNLTARQLVGSMKANDLGEEAAAKNYRLPIEAIREATQYVERNLELLAAETEIERLMQKREGKTRVAQPVS